jgi:iron complex transport system permease protein
MSYVRVRDSGSVQATAVAFAVLSITCLIGLSAGSTWIPLPQLCSELIASPFAANARDSLVWEFRMPRVLLCVIIGASLSIAGVAIQTGARNPLADPYILGVSSGACFGAVLVLLIGLQMFRGLVLTSGALCGGIAATAAVLLLARDHGTLSPHRLILSGVAVTYLLTALTSFCLLLIDRNHFGGSNNFLFWAMGSFSRARWGDLPIPAAALGICMLVLAGHARILDVMNMNDESVSALGVDPDRMRLRLFFVVAVLVASSVAVSGQVGFVGLVIPHIARRLVGASHLQCIPLAGVIGAIFLVIADAVARTIIRPQEIPVGVITAGCGAPFFIAILRSRMGGVGR